MESCANNNYWQFDAAGKETVETPPVLMKNKQNGLLVPYYFH